MGYQTGSAGISARFPVIIAEPIITPRIAQRIRIAFNYISVAADNHVIAVLALEIGKLPVGSGSAESGADATRALVGAGVGETAYKRNVVDGHFRGAVGKGLIIFLIAVKRPSDF
jgi:hypothetical protein